MVWIYELFCKETGKSYVGSTSGTLGKRMREHRCLLKAGKHAEPELQADWDKYGEGAFEMRPALRHEPPDARCKRAAEIGYMELLAERGLLYNSRLIAYQPPPGASALAVKARVSNGYRPSPESNEKRRLAQLGKPKGHGAKISETKRRKRDEIVCSAQKNNVQK
jgi:hypothetical protein